MNRLSLYLLRLFTRDTLALLALMLVLLFLVQCLKIFDVVAVQGQNLWTLVGQALLGMPDFAIVLGYVCMGIGLVRAMAALQARHELHIMHANRRLGTLIGTVLLFGVLGSLVLLLISNLIEPWANRRLDDWVASVAADVVGHTLTPHRFSQVVPGVTFVIGGRANGGLVSDFFADDQRDPHMRHTYIAASARIADAGQGYVLELHDGSLQYLTDKGDFSQVAFKSYNVALDKLTQQIANDDDLGGRNTAELFAQATTGGWTIDIIHRLAERFADGLGGLAMVVFMAGLTIFPNGRRRRGRVPMELVPIFVAYAGKAISSSIGLPDTYAPLAGPSVILVAGLIILLARLHPLQALALRAARAA